MLTSKHCTADSKVVGDDGDDDKVGDDADDSKVVGDDGDDDKVAEDAVDDAKTVGGLINDFRDPSFI